MEEDDGSGEKRSGGERVYTDEMEQKGEPKYDRVFFFLSLSVNILVPSTMFVSMSAGRAASDVDVLLRSRSCSRSRSLSRSLSLPADEASPARRCLFFWASMALSLRACLWPL